jgi:hypothetical protein
MLLHVAAAEGKALWLPFPAVAASTLTSPDHGAQACFHLQTSPLLISEPRFPAHPQVFDFDRWRKHRSASRYLRHARATFTSRIVSHSTSCVPAAAPPPPAAARPAPPSRRPSGQGPA